MNSKTEKRELFILGGAEGLVRGTYHKAHRADAASQEPPDQGRAGIVIVNSLSPTRAANGDGAVYLADLFAELGYPAFRVDLAGFGDADGNAPDNLADFINRGGYAPEASTAIEQIVARFGLSGVIILGHCAGSLTALFTAAASKNCHGLILMGPYFHLPAPPHSKVRARLSTWAMRNPVGRLLSRTFDGLKAIRLALRAKSHPENANRPLIRCWKDLTSAGMPMLVVQRPAHRASGKQTRTGEFDYMQYVMKLAGPQSEVELQFAEGADHSFANREGRVEVGRFATQWLRAHFPLPRTEARVESLPPADCGVVEELVKG